MALGRTHTSTTSIVMISPSKTLSIYVWLMIVATHVRCIVPVKALAGGAFVS